VINNMKDYNDQFLLLSKQLLAKNYSDEDLMYELRKQNCSKVNTMRIMVELKGLSLSQAKELVHSSNTWNDKKASDEKFQDQIIKIVGGEDIS